MKFKILWCVIFLASSTYAQTPAPLVFDGFVEDAASGMEIVGAKVSVSGQQGSPTMTDSNGHFQFNLAPNVRGGDTIIVAVSAAGYQQRMDELPVSNTGLSHKFKLSRSKKPGVKPSSPLPPRQHDVEKSTHDTAETIKLVPPPEGWLPEWGMQIPPLGVRSTVDVSTLLQYHKPIPLMLIYRIDDKTVDEQADTRIVKSNLFLVADTPRITIDVQLPEDFLVNGVVQKLGRLPVEKTNLSLQMKVALVVLPKGTTGEAISRISDATKLGGAVLIINGFPFSAEASVEKKDAPPPVGDITQGPGSILQYGGVGNQATIINPPSPTRNLSPEQVAFLKNVLSGYSTQFEIKYDQGTNEAYQFSSQVAAALKAAGWTENGGLTGLLVLTESGSPPQTGVVVSYLGERVPPGTRVPNDLSKPWGRLVGALVQMFPGEIYVNPLPDIEPDSIRIVVYRNPKSN